MRDCLSSSAVHRERRTVSAREESELHERLTGLADFLDEGGEDRAAANVRLAIARLTFLQNETTKNKTREMERQ